MKDLPIHNIAFLPLLRRYHLVIFTVIMTLILSGSVLLLYSVVTKASGEDSVPLNSTISGFDQTTIDSINSLKTSEEPSEPLDFSQGRINPFGE